MPQSGDASLNKKATTSFVLGIIGLVAWFLPIVGAPVTIVGLVFGIKGRASAKSGLAVAGITLSIIGLVLTVVNASIGAYTGVTGQNPIANEIMSTNGTE